MSWIGGKKALRDEILLRFPVEYERYIEVFGGGGWVLFRKPPDDFEVYNDFNPNLTNLFRCVREHPKKLTEALRYTLNSRLDFKHARQMLKSETKLPDIKRAAYFYQLIRQSYASGLDSYGGVPRSMWSKFPLIDAAAGRLQKVVIENRDFEPLIKQYDRPKALFYCDPPYYATEDYYEDVEFTKDDHQRLADALLNIQGKFLLSYNDCPEIRELYQSAASGNQADIYIAYFPRSNDPNQNNWGHTRMNLMGGWNVDATDVFPAIALNSFADRKPGRANIRCHLGRNAPVVLHRHLRRSR